MINKLIPLVLIVVVLSGCDGGAPPKAATAISNATNISAAFPAVYASLPKKVGAPVVLINPRLMVITSLYLVGLRSRLRTAPLLKPWWLEFLPTEAKNSWWPQSKSEKTSSSILITLL